MSPPRTVLRNSRILSRGIRVSTNVGAESAIPSKDSVTANVDAVVCQRFFNAVVSVVKRRWPTRGQHKCYTLCVSCVPTVYAIVHCILSIDLLSLSNSSMHLVPGRVLTTLQIGTKFNHSSTRVKEMDTVHPIYLVLTICAPQ